MLEQAGILLHTSLDPRAAAALVRESRPAERLADFPSSADLEEMLGDPAYRAGSAAWMDAGGCLQAYALVDPDCESLAFEARPGPLQLYLEQAALDWACRRAGSLGLAGPLETSCSQDDAHRLDLLAGAGFTILDEATLVYERPLAGSLPEPALPPGFSIRPLAGENELGAVLDLHHAVNPGSQMTASYRLAMMHAPAYLPEGDLVAVDAQGNLAGYCTCWFSREDNLLTGHRTGYTDPVGVRPDCRRKGLAAALLYSGFRLLQGLGMDTARLSTSSANLAGQRTFESVGYRLVQTRLHLARQT